MCVNDQRQYTVKIILILFCFDPFNLKDSFVSILQGMDRHECKKFPGTSF